MGLNKGSTNQDEIFNIGLEWSYEGIKPEKFKAESPEEMRVFLEGYKKGLEIQAKQSIEHEESGIKMAA